MNYVLGYAKIAWKHWLSAIEPYGSWKVRLTNMALSSFWLLDIPLIALSLGRTRSFFHEKASQLWFDWQLLEMADNDNPKWAKRLVFSMVIVIFA